VTAIVATVTCRHSIQNRLNRRLIRLMQKLPANYSDHKPPSANDLSRAQKSPGAIEGFTFMRTDLTRLFVQDWARVSVRAPTPGTPIHISRRARRQPTLRKCPRVIVTALAT